MSKKKKIKVEKIKQKSNSAKNNKKHSMSWLTWDFILLLALVLFVLLIRFSLLGIPLERDEGGFAFTAQQMLAGKNLYSELYDIKLPLLYGLYALFITLFGNSVEGIHLGLIIFDISYIVLLFLFCKSYFSKTVAVIAAFAFAILSLGPNLLGFATHATHLAILPGLVGLYILNKATESNNKRLFFFSGLACGLAFLVKQQAVHFMLMSGFYVMYVQLIDHKKRDFKNWIINELFLVAGSIAPYCCIIVYMIIMGRMDEFWFYTFVWPSEYATSSSTGGSTEIFNMQFHRVIANQEWLWYLALGGAISMFLVKTENKLRAFMLLFTIFMTFGLATGFHFYPHYFVILIPVIAIYNGLFVQNIGIIINKATNIKWGFIFPTILFFYAWSQIIRYDNDYFFKPDYDQILRNCYGTNPFPESKVIGEFIKKYTNKNDKIVIACSEPQIGFYAQRISTSGQIFTYPLVDNGKYMTDLQDEFIESIKELPRISVYTWMNTSWLNKDQSGRTFKAIEENHQENYNLIGVAECLPSRNSKNGPIIWNTIYKWQKDAVDYFNQRMKFWQDQNAKSQEQIPPPSLLSIWELKKEKVSKSN